MHFIVRPLFFMSELIQTFSRFTGREVRFVRIPWDEFGSRAGKDLN